jgi:hypothetical protein
MVGRFNSLNGGFPIDEALALIEELTEARKPMMHTATEVAERTLRQSVEQLAARHEKEWPQATGERRQAILRFWVAQHSFIERMARSR